MPGRASALYPKWSFPAYIVLTIAVGAIFVYRVVRGGEWFIFLMLFLVFGFNVYVSWHVSKKATDTPKPTG
jgi:lipopolysaccharide export LptBFGC system permease protein LptF